MQTKEAETLTQGKQMNRLERIDRKDEETECCHCDCELTQGEEAYIVDEPTAGFMPGSRVYCDQECARLDEEATQLAARRSDREEAVVILSKLIKCGQVAVFDERTGETSDIALACLSGTAVQIKIARTHWSDLLCGDGAESPMPLGDVLASADPDMLAELAGIRLGEDGGIESWEGTYVFAPGEAPATDTPRRPVDWAGFADALRRSTSATTIRERRHGHRLVINGGGASWNI